MINYVSLSHLIYTYTIKSQKTPTWETMITMSTNNVPQFLILLT